MTGIIVTARIMGGARQRTMTTYHDGEQPMPSSIDVVFEQRAKTIEDVALHSGLSEKRVLSIVRGCWLPSPKERQRLADAIGVSVEDVDWGHTMSPRNVRYHRFGLKEDFS